MPHGSPTGINDSGLVDRGVQQWMGYISVVGDFPLAGEAQDGWTYQVTSPVPDPITDPVTGKMFTDCEEITWQDGDWVSWGLPPGTPGAHTHTISDITDITFQNIVDVDPSQPEVAGKRYTSYATAVAYILGVTTPSYFNRWGVRVHGWQSLGAAPVMNPWIYPMGYPGKTGLVSSGAGDWTNTGGVSHVEAYMMFNLSTGSVDPAAGTTIQVWDSVLNDQETTAGTGTIWLKRSNMFDGDNNADVSTCTLIVDDISQAVIQDAGSVICYGAYYLTVKGTSIGFLQTYGAGGQIYLNANVSLGGGFIYGAEIYGVDFGALSLPDINVTLSTLSGAELKALVASALTYAMLASTRTLTFTAGSNQIINTILYDVDIVVDGAATALETVGSMRGIGTETITEASSGTWTNRGDIYDPSATGLVSVNTQDAIDEHVTDTADPHKSHTVTKVAAVALSARRAVFIDGSDEVDYADNTTVAHADKVLGLTKTAVGAAASVEVHTFGDITDGGWTWAVGSPIFLSTTGFLTQTPPASGFLIHLGYATSATSMFLRIQEPTILIP